MTSKSRDLEIASELLFLETCTFLKIFKVSYFEESS